MTKEWHRICGKCLATKSEKHLQSPELVWILGHSLACIAPLPSASIHAESLLPLSIFIFVDLFYVCLYLCVFVFVCVISLARRTPPPPPLLPSCQHWSLLTLCSTFHSLYSYLYLYLHFVAFVFICVLEFAFVSNFLITIFWEILAFETYFHG